MSIRIVADSCCEIPEYIRSSVKCVRVPLTITVDDLTIVDDETFVQDRLLKAVAASRNCARSACPSPERYMQAFEGEEEDVFVITLSADLSGSYNSAVLAKSLYEEEHDDKHIHVFNSKSASGGGAHVAVWIDEYCREGLSFDEIVARCEKNIDEMTTWFVLETLEELRKNGRLSNLKALAATTLNLKPICSSDNGSIIQTGIARGMKHALSKMIDQSLAKTPDTRDRVLIINHCNCFERAQEVLASYIARTEFRNTMIIDTAGISSLYAADGGIIVTF